MDGVKMNNLTKDFIFLQYLLNTISGNPPMLSNIEKPCLTTDGELGIFISEGLSSIGGSASRRF